MVTTKGRKNDLPVQSGDLISIVRTTKCPKGKWLARDSSNNCEFTRVHVFSWSSLMGIKPLTQQLIRSVCAQLGAGSLVKVAALT